MITTYQAKYYAYELLKRATSDSSEKFGATFMDALQIRIALSGGKKSIQQFFFNGLGANFLFPIAKIVLVKLGFA